MSFRLPKPHRGPPIRTGVLLDRHPIKQGAPCSTTTRCSGTLREREAVAGPPLTVHPRAAPYRDSVIDRLGPGDAEKRASKRTERRPERNRLYHERYAENLTCEPPRVPLSLGFPAATAPNGESEDMLFRRYVGIGEELYQSGGRPRVHRAAGWACHHRQRGDRAAGGGSATWGLNAWIPRIARLSSKNNGCTLDSGQVWLCSLFGGNRI